MAEGGKYFSTTKRGEIKEWKEELAGTDPDKKKEAVKRVIAQMTQGRDVSMLFTDVVNCMQTSNMELKKLVYLYLMNYAKSQPDLAILAVNTFVKDSQDPNPLVRALAVRTMGCIRVDKITEYLGEPLRKCLKDTDPYVRKTAAVCVAKLYDINPEMVEDFGFLENLQDMLADANPMVVANAVAALSEIAETSKKNPFQLNASTLNKLLAALNECTEWGQVFILDSLAKYVPSDSREAESICERVGPRLQHANSAVVLSAVKVIMKYMDILTSPDTVRHWCQKMAPPLVTLLSAEPEVQYVALRNIDLIVQKRPNILAREIKVFFCKYNDPLYIKMEKLEIMIKLASERNIDQVLLEFKEYATEVDVDFVRRSVRAVGRCAIKLEKVAQRCINILLELIQTKVNYVVQEAIIVIKDIFRRYPNRYETIIATLCENLDTLDDPEAKAAMIWIVGEYAERIDNADELLEAFLETFSEEIASVQLQLLTATVKLFLKKPSQTQEMVQSVLKMATQDSDNPDLRDRGYVYWRLLSTDPEAAKTVVLSEKPLISDTASELDSSLLDRLVGYIATLAAVYHKPPESFVSKLKRADVPKVGETSKGYSNEEEEEQPATTATVPTPSPKAKVPEPVIEKKTTPAVTSVADDLLGLDLGAPTPIQPKAPVAAVQSGADDLLGDFGMSSETTTAAAPPTAAAEVDFAPKVSKSLLVDGKGQHPSISGCFVRRDDKPFADFTFENKTNVVLNHFAIQFNKNFFGIAAGGPLAVPATQIGQSSDASLPLRLGASTAELAADASKIMIQMAIKSDTGVVYFQQALPLHVVLSKEGKLEQKEFMALWKSIDDSNERLFQLDNLKPHPSDTIRAILEAHNIFFIAQRSVGDGQIVMYFAAKTDQDVVILLELSGAEGSNSRQLAVRSADPRIASLVDGCLKTVLA